MGKIPLKWILLGLLILLIGGYVSVQVPGVQCTGTKVYCPGVGCVSGPDKCVSGAVGGPSATFSTTWEKFTNGKDMYPGPPKFEVGPTPVISNCPDGTRAHEGRCSEFLGP